MKIEWASSFRPDGSRQKPAPSTVHGWLAKMRGTLVGDEDLRKKGMREMKAAQQWSAMSRDRKKRARNSSSLFRIFRFTSKKQSSANGGRARRARTNTLARPRPSQKSSSGSSASRHKHSTSKKLNSTRRRPSKARPPPAHARRLNRR